MFNELDIDMIFLLLFFPYLNFMITESWGTFFATVYPQVLEKRLPGS